MKYTVILERERDGGYVASVPALPGCVSEGGNREETLANIQEAIELYIEDCRLSGDPIPEEDSVETVQLIAGPGPPSARSGCRPRVAADRKFLRRRGRADIPAPFPARE